MDPDKPAPYALEKLSKAVSRLDARGEARQRIHDATEGLAVIGSDHLRPLQDRFLEQIIGALTANPSSTDSSAADPRVMENLQGMPPEKLEEIEADIRLLFADVQSYFS